MGGRSPAEQVERATAPHLGRRGVTRGRPGHVHWRAAGVVPLGVACSEGTVVLAHVPLLSVNLPSSIVVQTGDHSHLFLHHFSTLSSPEGGWGSTPRPRRADPGLTSGTFPRLLVKRRGADRTGPGGVGCSGSTGVRQQRRSLRDPPALSAWGHGQGEYTLRRATSVLPRSYLRATSVLPQATFSYTAASTGWTRRQCRAGMAAQKEWAGLTSHLNCGRVPNGSGFYTGSAEGISGAVAWSSVTGGILKGKER